MGLSNSRPRKEGVYAHLRDQTRLIEDLQTYLNRVDKLLADSETAHKGVRRAVETFFPADAPSHDVVVKLMQSMMVFEQVRSDLRLQTNTARRTFQTLLDKARHLERLVKERDKLSRKVEAHEKNLEKLRLKYNMNPSPSLQKRLAKVEGKYNNVHRQFKIKDFEAEQETSNAMDGRYAEAVTLVSQQWTSKTRTTIIHAAAYTFTGSKQQNDDQRTALLQESALIIIQYVQMTAPEMEKAQSLLALLQQSAGGLHSSPFRPLTPRSPATGHIYISEHSDTQLRGAEAAGDASQGLCQANQQPSIAISFPEKSDFLAGQSRETPREPCQNAYQQKVHPPAPSTQPSPEASPFTGILPEKDAYAASSVESNGQMAPSGGGVPNNPFESDL